MSTKTKQRAPEHDVIVQEDSIAGQDLLSAQELEAVLFEDADRSAPGPVNLTTVAGLGLIAVGLLYLLQLTNLLPGNLGGLVTLLIWMAGAFIILIGTGANLSGSSKKKRKPKRKSTKRRKVAKSFQTTGKKDTQHDYESAVSKLKKKRLRRSHNKKILGVAGGIAEYFGIDPTLVRVAVIILAISTMFTTAVVYLVLGWAMGIPETSGSSGDD